MAIAREIEALAEPLTLNQALTRADAPHPGLQRARAALELARAGVLQARSATGLRAYLELIPQSVDPAVMPGQEWVGDSRARLVVSKPLYDFGRSRARRDAAAYEVMGQELRFLDTRQQRRIEIMARFFDVLLADLRYAVDNETMAYSYVRFDKLRDREELGMVAEVDLLEMESGYRDVLHMRTKSEKRQTSTRAALAIALNQPDRLPGELVHPELPGNDRSIPEYRKIVADILKRSPVLLALHKEVEAAEAKVGAARARRYPVMSAEFEAAEYTKRRLGSRDDMRATLNLHIPIYQGGEVAADVARAGARLRQRQADLAETESGLRQVALDLVQRLESLKVARKAAKVRVDYQDMNLDRARSIYELEMRSTLGDAMTRLSEAQWAAARIEFQLALSWAKLDALTGGLVDASNRENRE